MSSVDTVVSDAVSGCLCDIDSVSRGDLVVRVGEMSLSGGGDAAVSGVHGSVCGVSSVLADGILDLSGIDTVVYGVDEPVCDVRSVMTTVACGDDTLLPAAFRVDGSLSVVGLGVAQPGWVDGLIRADDSLRPEPPPMHAMYVFVS